MKNSEALTEIFAMNNWSSSIWARKSGFSVNQIIRWRKGLTKNIRPKNLIRLALIVMHRINWLNEWCNECEMYPVSEVVPQMKKQEVKKDLLLDALVEIKALMETPFWGKKVIDTLGGVYEAGLADSIGRPGYITVCLVPSQIEKNAKVESRLFGKDITKSIYVIRKLRAAIYYGHQRVSLKHDPGKGQVYSRVFKVWFDGDEFVPV